MSAEGAFRGPSLKEAPLGTRPIGLVLSGGAALGAWQGGALCAFEREHGLAFDWVIGTSSGSLNGAAYLQGDLGTLAELWKGVRRKDFFRLGPGLRPPRLYRQDSLREYLAGVIDEGRCRREGRSRLSVISADVLRGETVHGEFHPGGGRWDAPLLGHLLGSIAVPFLLPPSRVPGPGGDRLLVDGHLTSFVNLRPLVEAGVRDLLFVTVVGREALARPHLSPRGWISTLINQLLRAQVDNGLAPLESSFAREGLRAFELTPSEPLRMSVFRFYREECARAFEQGRRDSEAFMADSSRFRIR